MRDDSCQTLSTAHTWSILAPFFVPGGANDWIDDQLRETAWQFRKVPRRASGGSWHTRAKRATDLNTWREYWSQALRAFPAAGIITVFPQLAVTAAIQKRILKRNVPLISWCFNLGDYPHGWKRMAARSALMYVDRFVVHSTGEIEKVSDFLGIPRRKVRFVPLQRAPIPVLAVEELHEPFIVSMGSANRDYDTFMKAASISGLPCKVVASPRSIKDLEIPSNVSVQFGLSHSECHSLVQKSRFSVVPLLDREIASGQVTVIESMRMKRAVIATQSIGTTDYIRSGVNGAMVPPHDPEALASAMQELWENQALREQYTRNAWEFAEESLSDAAAASALAGIIRDVELERGQR